MQRDPPAVPEEQDVDDRDPYADPDGDPDRVVQHDAAEGDAEHDCGNCDNRPYDRPKDTSQGPKCRPRSSTPVADGFVDEVPREQDIEHRDCEHPQRVEAKIPRGQV